jgi:carbon-monoxide dehydrogenase large subunit
MPPMILGETITPNPFNPLGVKGVGDRHQRRAAVGRQRAWRAQTACIDHVDMPYTAPKLWELTARRGEERQ